LAFLLKVTAISTPPLFPTSVGLFKVIEVQPVREDIAEAQFAALKKEEENRKEKEKKRKKKKKEKRERERERERKREMMMM